VSIYKLQNNARSTLAVAINSAATTLSIASGHGPRFPEITAGQYTRLTLQDAANRREIVEVTAHVANAEAFTIVRGRESTIALDWDVGAIVELRLTADVVATLDGVQTLQNKTINALENTLSNVSLAERLTSVAGVNDLTASALGVTAYLNGQRFSAVLANPNTGPMTLAINGLAALPLVKDQGRALVPGDLPAGQVFHLDCDGTKFWVSYGVAGLTVSAQTALALKAPLENPVFTGSVVVPSAVEPTAPVPLSQMTAEIKAQLELLAFDVGDYKFSARTSFPVGRRWLLCNGATIGNAGSGATALASADAQELFEYLWATYSQDLCPVTTSAGAASARGASANADWLASKRLALLDWRGVSPKIHHGGSATYEADVARALGSFQSDAIRNITGGFYNTQDSGGFTSPSGAFTLSGTGYIGTSGKYPVGSNNVTFNASAVVPTAAENRVKNRSLNMFIRY
jgi:hypothetical protein